MKTPDYVLDEAYTHHQSWGTEGKTLPAGSFVRPIEFRYLPKEMRDEPKYQYIEKDGTSYFCYTHIGIIAIPKDKVRKV